MDRSTYLESLASDADAFYAAVARTSLDVPVAACPGWSLEDLVYHVGEVHHFWGDVVARQVLRPDEVEEPARPSSAAVVGWANAETDRLRAVLASAHPATRVWTWLKQQDVAFVVRRMAQETAVHRWDAERAARAPSPIAAALASDGIDEFLTFMLPDARAGVARLAGSIHLHCTDTPGEWLVRPGDDGAPVVTPEHAKGDAAMRGAASDLLLVLWRRLGLDAIDVIGDRSVAEGFVARTNND
jgi:uncharacterized protein (TIGR03083 family)